MEGGTPLEFPTISLREMFTSPTTMLYRNLAAMNTEEMIAAQPIDGTAMISGCDKMAPAQRMGAASADKPATLSSGGPMNNRQYKERKLGAWSDCRYFWQEYKAGTVDEEEISEINKQLAPTAGHCMVMGSASTIASCAEALGMMLPGGAATPATYNERIHMAKETGRAIVRLVRENIKPSDIMTEKAFENAMKTLMAIGGSTNSVIHLTAIAKRLNINLSLDRFDEISRNTPFIANFRPAGKYQMQDLYHAGGIPAVLKEMESLLNKDEITVSTKSLSENSEGVEIDEVYRDIIKPIDQPLHEDGGIAVLKGNLAPSGAIIKPKAIINQQLSKHRGQAIVFSSTEDMEKKINAPDLDVDKNSVLVLQNTGPVGAPGMPEAGMIPIPDKLLKQGVRDMVRISDCRMSGTAFGTVVLHAAPEAAVGGNIGLIRDGDWIELDVQNRKLNVEINDEEFKKRQENWLPPTKELRGYTRMYQKHVMQADQGCDFDFMLPKY